eukprot:NODE_4_length_77007_cov_1.156642.p28 type:complete len:326 gc:universal NODE_4_length_77007_cov_1.156642:35013-34036(-)
MEQYFVDEFYRFQEGDFLGYCIINNDMNEFKRQMPPNIPHFNLCQYLFACSELGRLEMMDLLPRNYSITDEYGYNLLHNACKFGYLEMVKMLLHYQTDLLKSCDNDGVHPTMLACENGHYDIVEYLIEGDPSILSMPIIGEMGSCLNAILSRKIDERSLKLISRMVELEPNLVNIRKYGTYPIIQVFCVENEPRERKEIFKLYTEKGFNLDVTDERGKTLLHFAIKENDLWYVDMLTQAGITLDRQDVDGNTPLHDYYEYSKSQKFCFRKFEAPANWQIQNKHGMTPISLRDFVVSLQSIPGRKRPRSPTTENFESPDAIRRRFN